MVLGGAEAGPEVTQRFWTEARAAAGLNHPGIVPVVEVGDHDGQAFYSMEFVEGGSLAERVKDGPLPPREAVRLVRQVAEAVQAAHDKGIIHRDIKPHNILLAATHEGGATARLTDFGLARTREGGGSVTGELLGTPSYMAPEQAAGKVRAVSAATDVYGLGAVLYCLLTGRPPFQSSGPLETMRLVLESEPVPVRQLNPAVPRDLETVCHQCLQKEPGKRYQTAGELAAELSRFLGGQSVLARPVGRLEARLALVSPQSGGGRTADGRGAAALYRDGAGDLAVADGRASADGGEARATGTSAVPSSGPDRGRSRRRARPAGGTGRQPGHGAAARANCGSRAATAAGVCALVWPCCRRSRTACATSWPNGCWRLPTRRRCCCCASNWSGRVRP